MSIKISQLTEATAIGDTDVFPIVQGEETKKIPYDKVKYNGVTIWCGTQLQYDAIVTKDANTLYLIQE